MEMKKETEKAGLKLSVQKSKIMASGPITSWQIDGENVETVSDLIFMGSKITVHGNCSHEIKDMTLKKKCHSIFVKFIFHPLTHKCLTNKSRVLATFCSLHPISMVSSM